MKDISITIEIGVPDGYSWWKPGSFKSTVGGRAYRRVWWLCFAVTFYAGSQEEYGRAIESGMTEWRRP